MSTASPTAFLLWAILSVLFLVFLVYHLWSYDHFRCVLWSAGRQPGAFKRVMTYSYLGSVPLFVVYSVATTVIKYKEGAPPASSPSVLPRVVLTPPPSRRAPASPRRSRRATPSLARVLARAHSTGFVVTPDARIIPRPVGAYSAAARAWVVPLNFVFSFAWALELVTHLEELAFWLYLLHQHPDKDEWFASWEYRLWYCGSIVAILGMPLTALIARRHIDTIDAYIFLSGSSGSTSTTVAFLYVLWRFPGFIRHVKAEGADPAVVVRLATFFQLNLARVVFRFMFTLPLMVLALDGIIGTRHPVNNSLFWTGAVHPTGMNAGALTAICRLSADDSRNWMFCVDYDHAPHLLPAFDRKRGRIQAQALLDAPKLAQEPAHHPAIARGTLLARAVQHPRTARLAKRLGRRVGARRHTQRGRVPGVPRVPGVRGRRLRAGPGAAVRRRGRAAAPAAPVPAQPLEPADPLACASPVSAADPCRDPARRAPLGGRRARVGACTGPEARPGRWAA
ncbi:hypothetical protein AcV7_010358 [Taiwanofungus camphoratus]|nr:hypothetical protein AcV7_010358 [Antrodia cinnamomea]